MADKHILSAEKRMTTIANDLTELIGQTPMVWLSPKINDTHAKIALKLECLNPMRSVKDRLALGVILEAEKEGKITPGKTTIVDLTSGNTGIGLGLVAAVRGYKVAVAMAEGYSLERRTLLAILGVEVHLTPNALGFKGVRTKVEQLLKSIPDSYDMNQFESEYNAKVHAETTAPEIWSQTEGQVAAVVVGCGTGGTAAGITKFLKEKNADIKCYVMEPDESAVMSGECANAHMLQGLGSGIVSEIIKTHRDQFDGIIRVKSQEAIEMARKIPRTEGLYCGISSGANIIAALEVARRPENKGKLIVTIAPSYGERYLSTHLYDEVMEQVKNLKVISESELLPEQSAASSAASAVNNNNNNSEPTTSETKEKTKCCC